MEQKRPLMYIKQPTFQQIARKMQTVAVGTSSPEEKKSEKIRKASPKQAKAESVEEFKKELLTATTPPSSEQHAQEKEHPVKKRFNEMSTEEKLYYLYQSIPGVTKLKAEFRTVDHKVYRGIVSNIEEGTVELRNMHAPFKVKVDMQMITDVQLIGF